MGKGCYGEWVLWGMGVMGNGCHGEWVSWGMGVMGNGCHRETGRLVIGGDATRLRRTRFEKMGKWVLSGF